MQTPFSPLDDAPGLRVIQSSRIAAILKLLEARSSLSIAELAARFDCSEETIRRDIRQLEQTGRVLKVHGGVRTPDADFEAPYRLRFREQAEAKQWSSGPRAGALTVRPVARHLHRAAGRGARARRERRCA